MKKVILLAVALVLVIAFAACGNNDNDSDTTTPVTPPADNQPADTTPPDEPTPPPADYADDVTEGAVATGAPDFAADLDGFLDYHFPATDLGGVTLRWVGFGNPYHDNPVYAARYQERRERVEERFNVRLEFIENDDIVAIAGAWGDVPDVMIASVAAGDPIAHAFRGNAGYWFPSLANGGYLIDMDAHIRANLPSGYYSYLGESATGRAMGFAYQPAYAWNVMTYNRDMIRAAGMAMTPSEMFREGRWSLDDFYDYLVELNQLTGADVTPFGIHHQWWFRLASYANGGYILNPRTSAPGILLDQTLEPMILLQRLIQDGLYLQPGFLEEGDRNQVPGGLWAWTADHLGGSHIELFRNGNVAITSMAPWDFEETGNFFEFGIVPPPWGSNVTFPGDWRDLKTHTPYRSVFNDGTTMMLVQGTPDAVTPEVFMNMAFTWFENRAEQLVNIRGEIGGDGVIRLGSSQHLFTPGDVEIWEWYASNSTWEGMDSGGFWAPAIQDALNNTLATTRDFRSAFEAVMPQLTWQLYDFGRLSRENIPDAMWTQAAEFGATMGD